MRPSMRVVFPRLADGTRAHSVVHRGDGVSYRVHEGIAGPGLPHDLVHLIVERELGADGGFWGAVAAGAVFASMRHLSGRRPPHAARRSADAVRARKDRLQRAELMAGLVGHVAARNMRDPDKIRAMAREELSTLPDPHIDAEAVLRAARALRDTAERWRALPVGAELTVDWPRAN